MAVGTNDGDGPRGGSQGGGNRALIRPSVSTHGRWTGSAPERRRRDNVAKEDTGAEAAHYSKQVNLGTPMEVTLEDGEVLRGVLEWYDRDSVKLRQEGGRGLLIFKHAILHTARVGKGKGRGRSKSKSAASP